VLHGAIDFIVKYFPYFIQNPPDGFRGEAESMQRTSCQTRIAMRNLPIILVLIIYGICLQYRQPAAMAAQTSYAAEIAQDVREDKVYLLEKIRPRITKPSEKILVEALLTEDGPKAAKLYRKQLAEYPDPQLDPISRSRLAAYEQATTMTPGLPVMPANASSNSKPPQTGWTQTRSVSGNRPDSSMKRLSPPRKPKPAEKLSMQSTPESIKKDTTALAIPETPVQKPSQATSAGSFTLQFGSFDSITNADQLSAQISQTAPASVQKINGIYKVRLKRTFATRQEAAAFARTLPVESFVVPQRP
jgi:cell division protein FtsN